MPGTFKRASGPMNGNDAISQILNDVEMELRRFLKSHLTYPNFQYQVSIELSAMNFTKESQIEGGLQFTEAIDLEKVEENSTSLVIEGASAVRKEVDMRGPHSPSKLTDNSGAPMSEGRHNLAARNRLDYSANKDKLAGVGALPQGVSNAPADDIAKGVQPESAKPQGASGGGGK